MQIVSEKGSAFGGRFHGREEPNSPEIRRPPRKRPGQAWLPPAAGNNTEISESSNRALRLSAWSALLQNSGAKYEDRRTGVSTVQRQQNAGTDRSCTGDVAI